KKEKIHAFITKKILKRYLGPGKPRPNYSVVDRIGRSLALYSVGMSGNVLPIEATLFPGTGQYKATGNIHPLLEEIVAVALSYLKQHHKEFHLNLNLLLQTDLHLHFFKSELLKEGEGWGLAIFVAILSAYLEKTVPGNVAFSGDISLLGSILPVKHVEEKILAANQLGIDMVVLSDKNFIDRKIKVPGKTIVKAISNMDEVQTILSSTK
ncbi:MAG: hypothetical protein HRT90_04615, partial [Candidatus Margulisbacteria bacterium]|nr:hypothetical protein [Candidatus Margulisiibacteriota bacterium]